MAKSKRNELQVSIDDLDKDPIVDYSDGDIVVIDNIGDYPEWNRNKCTIKLDVVFFMLCENGKAQMRIRTRFVDVCKGDLFCCGPSTRIEDWMISPDFKAKILCLSTAIVQSIMQKDKNAWNKYFYLLQHPVLSLGENVQTIIGYYYALVGYYIKNPLKRYNKKVMASLVSAALYNLLNEIGDIHVSLGTNSGLVTQGDLLFNNFIKMLNQTDPIQRSVSYYAERLCVSPKYLSAVVKQTSGRTAIQWIAEQVTEEIKRRLTYSNIPIKQLADEMGFPNISFFGKYVKQHLGVSPTEFRRKLSQTDHSQE